MPLGILLVLCLQMVLCKGADELDHIGHSTRLLSHLLDPTRYNKMVVPRSNNTASVTVYARLVPMSLVEMNEKSGFMSFMFWKMTSWTDTRLMWNETEYGGIQRQSIPTQSIWFPDIILYNSARSQRTTGPTEQEVARVECNGRITRVYGVLYESTCVFDMHHFPFDVQTCYVKVGPRTYSGNVIDVIPIYRNVSRQFQKTNQNHAWHLEEATMSRNVKTYRSEKFIYLFYTFRLRRRSDFFRDLYVVPAVLVAMLVPFVFVLPVTRIHRYILGGVLLLVFTQLSMAFDSNTPTTDGGTPLIAQLFTCLQSLVAISLLLSAILTNLSNKGACYTTPPRLIQKIIIDVLGRIMCISSDHQTSTLMVTDGDDNGDSSGTVTSTWLIMAQVLDRLFFLVYCVAFVIMAIAFAAVRL